MAHDDIDIRKVITKTEILWREGGRPLEDRTRIAVAAAVLRNPWAGQGFVEDLAPKIHEIAPVLGQILTDVLVEQMDGAPIEAYGKAATVGLSGELEHASALIHTLRFGNILRDRVGGSSFLPFTNRRASADTVTSIPMVHIKDSGIRSHYLTAELHVSDAPRDDELLVAIAGASAGRPFARIGDRYQDMAILGVDQRKRP
ncbi:amino acid synthesis family protein [Dactylosporangium roseum]|uniref:Amino acid synthesis family protein n=1 Tax=Dactylosporangium roseum TaxID=47989 RepID=A0ABY5ZCB3_9ACTN|nr:amino acid synthesis family protein [Dactylosporangium roseum]UWZ39714.1 amino acid synthesis family protein [Dactylosporangium roseum]